MYQFVTYNMGIVTNRYKMEVKILRIWLRKRRATLNMTQYYVASHSGIQRAYYTAIENGDRRPSVDVAKRIALVLNFDWTIFFDDKGVKSLHSEVGNG